MQDEKGRKITQGRGVRTNGDLIPDFDENKLAFLLLMPHPNMPKVSLGLFRHDAAPDRCNGDVFGLESGSARRLAAEAIEDTTVRLVKRSSLEKAAGRDVQVARKLWMMTAGELKHAEDHMLLLGRKSAMERVATFLLEMDRRLAVAGMMALPMRRRDIGDYLGLTLETVSRALSGLHCKRFGDEGYAMEELVAELGAAFLAADLALTPEVRDDHASYIASWIKVLKDDKRAIFTAASHAQRAADFLHGLQKPHDADAQAAQLFRRGDP